MIQKYFNTCIAQLQTVALKSKEGINTASTAIAEALIANRSFFLFGSGHSELIAREAFWRAGGLAPAIPIPDPLDGDVERLSGIAAVYLAHYDLQAGDVIIIISNSGINNLPVEMALECKARGMTIIALTSLAHSKAMKSRYPSGKKLLDIADVVIDTHGVLGDATLTLNNSKLKVGATSTVVGAAIIEAIISRTAEIMLKRGIEPPVLISSNTKAGDVHNRKLAKRYRQRLIRYEVPTVDAKTSKY